MASILALAVLLGAVSVGFAATRAAAHVCTNSVEVRVGKVFSVNIGVAAEAKPVTQVKIGVPEGFDLQDSFGFLGWSGARRGDVVEFAGGVIAPYRCGYFTLKGAAPKKGVYVARITVITEDGTVRRYTDTNPYSAFPAMMIYAGQPMPSPDDFGEDASGGGGGGAALRALGIALAAGALVVGVAWSLNQRRTAR